jgi:hypothetical protein
MFDLQIFGVRKLNGADVKERCRVRIPNSSVGSEKLDNSTAWEMSERISTFQQNRV